MNCLTKSRSLKIVSCLSSKTFNVCLVRRTSYSTVKPVYSFVEDEKCLSNQCNRGIPKFLAVHSRNMSNCDVRYRLILSGSCYQHGSPSLSSLSSPFSTFTEGRLYFSTRNDPKRSGSCCGPSQVTRDKDCNVKTDIDSCKSFDGVKIKSSEPLPEGNVESDTVEKKLSLFQKFKEMYRDYWYVLLPVHCVTSVFWFGGFYLLAESGVDIVAILEYIGISEILIDPFRNGNAHVKAGYIAVAFALYKIATPLRYTVTVGGTTVAINYLKKFGYIKPILKKEQLKAIYLEQKDILLEKKQQLKSNVFEHLKGVERNATSTAAKRK